MTDPAIDPAELASVDPDEQQFRADTLLMHSELVELSLLKIRRELFENGALNKINVGAGNPAEQTLRGYQKDPYNGLVVYNPTPVTLAVGFQAGLGVLAPITVPAFTWATFTERYVNLSVAVLNPGDQAQAIAAPVTLIRTKIPPPPGAGPYTSPAPPQPLTSLPAGSTALGGGVALDNGYPRNNHSLIVVSSAGVAAGAVQLAGSHDGQNYGLIGTAINTNAGGVVGASSATGPFRYVRAQITTAIAGGSITASVASA